MRLAFLGFMINLLPAIVLYIADAKNKSKGRDCNSFKKKNSKDVSAQCAVAINNENSSPEIFLPKEWTY
jgi:hypothetical protein